MALGVVSPCDNGVGRRREGMGRDREWGGELVQDWFGDSAIFCLVTTVGKWTTDYMEVTLGRLYGLV